MSTGSIFNNIKVTDRKFCRSLIKSMEESKSYPEKKVIMSKSVEDLDKEKILKLFGE